MDRFRALLTSFRAFWLGLARVQQVAIVGVILAVVAALGLLLTVAQRVEMVAVFRELPPNESAQIVQRLRDANVRYELRDNGQTILVPATQAQEIRLQMVGAGLVQGGIVGYEGFNQTGLAALGMTEFSQRLNLKRALEGELSRTIMRLDNVESAQVPLTLPQPPLLIEREKEPTGAAVLKLHQRGIEPVQGI